MNAEIGSEFCNIPVDASQNITLFPENTSWYLSGRSALAAIISEIKGKQAFQSVAMPSWCCGSMLRPFINSGIDVHFYSVIPEANGIRFNFSSLPEFDVLFVTDYFGHRRKAELPEFRGMVIRDMTHSVFCGNYSDADYYFGSMRKWTGFWTGGFAWKADGTAFPESESDEYAGTYISLRRQAMEEKTKYLSGYTDDKRHLSTFNKAEELLDTGITGTADARDIEAALHIDAESIKAKRRSNARFLLEKLADIAIFPSIKENDCPLFVPVVLPETIRNGLHKNLIQKDIYCPIHWSVSDMHRLNGQERKIYDTELSLVCDQRYSLKDMERERKAVIDALYGGGCLWN